MVGCGARSERARETNLSELNIHYLIIFSVILICLCLLACLLACFISNKTLFLLFAVIYFATKKTREVSLCRISLVGNKHTHAHIERASKH